MDFTVDKIRDAIEWGVEVDPVICPTLEGDKWIIMVHRKSAQGGKMSAGVLSRQRGGGREFRTLDAAAKLLQGELGLSEFTVKTDSH